MKLLRFVSMLLIAPMMAACAPVPAPTSAPPVATPFTGEPIAQLEAQWNGVGKSQNVLWAWRLTPPLPDAWPPTPSTVWARYAYGAGRDPQLADGERISAPWARVEYRGGAATVVPLLQSVSPKQVQGVFPMQSADAAALRSADTVATFMLTLTALPATAGPQVVQAQAFYRAWLNANGAIAGEVKVDAGFRAWANTPPPTPVPPAPFPTSVPPTDSKEIKFGETITPIPGLSLRFASLIEDSRCPTDGRVACVWSGVATVALEAQAGGQTATLRLSSIDAPSRYTSTAAFAGHTVRLVRVLPDSQTNVTRPPQAEYRVFVRVS